MAYACRVLADSISPDGHRLTSFETTFPRIVLAEVNTHKMVSKNSASSRAIPVEKRIAAVEADPFVPDQFGKNKKGMQHDEVLGAEADLAARNEWRWAMGEMIVRARNLMVGGVHKQLANRLLEPFAWHTAVLTATDWDNFFHLRVNPAAQGEFRRAAEMMLEAYHASEPHPVNYGEWHLPYVDPTEAFNLEVEERRYLVGEDEIWPAKVSAARCARVSYLTQNGVRDSKEDLALFDRLVAPGHLSPLEHVARPMSPSELEQFRTTRYDWTGIPPVCWREVGSRYYLGNLNGWVQLRKLIPGEHDILGHRAEKKVSVCATP